MELKKKSISVHTVTTIVLAVLLALSLLLGLSGAWFTDKATGNGSVKFGQVKVGDSITVTLPENIVPTQSIAIADTTYQGVAAYYRIKITVAGYAGTDPSEAELNEVLGANTVYGAWEESLTSSTPVSLPDITIAKTVGNEFQNIQCALQVTIDVIQQEGVAEAANLSETEISALTGSDEAAKAAAFEKIFAECTDYEAGTAK